jgi:hypothetical protein
MRNLDLDFVSEDVVQFIELSMICYSLFVAANVKIIGVNKICIPFHCALFLSPSMSIFISLFIYQMHVYHSAFVSLYLLISIRWNGPLESVRLEMLYKQK